MMRCSTRSFPRSSIHVAIFCCLCFTVAHAQERVVSGVVKSNEGSEGLAGVNVVVKGTSIGTITNVEGKYSLQVPTDAETLVFSFIGLVTTEVTIGTQSVIDIAMEWDSKQLAEVVVTALGIERDKKSLGYAVQGVGGDLITKVPTQSVVNNLSGRIAGLQVMGNATPGGSPEFVIRGFSSVGGNNQPLVVVDGVPIQQTVNTTKDDRDNNQRYGGGLSEIDPNSIAEISVLKGPNAAALYGSRAANGVILIKTKSGMKGQGIGVDVNFSTTFEDPLVKPKFQNTYGGGSGYTWYADGWSGTVDGFKGTAGTDESWGSPMDGRLVRQWWTGTETAPLVPQPDNWEQWWETGKTISSNVAITGGTEKSAFRLSIGRMDQDGIVYNNNFWRNNFRLNASHHFTDKLSLTAMGEYIKSGSDNRSFQSSSTFIWHHRHVNFNQLKNYKDYEDVHIQKAGDTEPPNWQHTYFTNPYYQEEVLVRPNEKDRFLGNVCITYDITPWLNVMARTGTDFWTDTRIVVSKFERTRNGAFARGAYSEEVLRRQETNSDFILSFNKTVASKLSVVAQVGGVHRTNYYKRNYTLVEQLTIDRVYNTGNNASPNKDESSIEETEVNSLFGSVQLGLNDFLFLDVTGRNDWSSTLPPANNSFFYPSVSLSAVLSDMFDLNDNILSYAKLRASWAEVGNDAPPYSLQQVFDPKGLYNGSVPKFAESKSIANSELKPESTTGIELGGEFKFLRGRVGLDVTYYDQSTKNQILAVDISRSSGYTSLTLNAGEITNKGIEITLNGTILKLPMGLTWDVGVNFSRNRNKVVELAEGLSSLTLWTDRGASLEARVGEPYGNLYGNKFNRTENGELIFTNGFPTNIPGQHVIGNITPDWLGGVFSTVKYKGVALNVLVDVKMGGDIYDMGTSLARITGQLEESEAGREEGTIGVGVKNVGTSDVPLYVPNDVVVPTRQFMGYYSGRQYHEAAVFDASYVKLREVSLSYSLPSKWFEKNFLQSVSLSLIGRNLAILFKNTTHIDPEISSGSLGYNYGQLPSTRSLGFNVNVKF
ncbi:MAG TPA: SusC/RagA family TonB-linked outer membrane protein [Cyclobacteriaceae bacterium]|nr:SusC/RagA family TonB-linked outer membrane protein [Cyclobacteriaceae bacterium]